GDGEPLRDDGTDALPEERLTEVPVREPLHVVPVLDEERPIQVISVPHCDVGAVRDGMAPREPPDRVAGDGEHHRVDQERRAEEHGHDQQQPPKQVAAGHARLPPLSLRTYALATWTFSSAISSNGPTRVTFVTVAFQM